MIRLALVFIFFFFAAGQFLNLSAQENRSEYDPDLFFDQHTGSSYLYFEDLSQMSNFETITILIGKTDEVERVLDLFYSFSKKIGETNGATIIEYEEYDKIANSLSKLNCETPRKFPSVHFASVVGGYCENFNLSEKSLLSILLDIDRNMNCKNLPSPNEFRSFVDESIKYQNSTQQKKIKSLANFLEGNFYKATSIAEPKHTKEHLLDSIRMSSKISNGCQYVRKNDHGAK